MMEFDEYNIHEDGVETVRRGRAWRRSHSMDIGPKLFNAKRITGFLGRLALDPDDYTLIGGANLTLRGVKPGTEDIDMLVSATGFKHLRSQRNAKLISPPHEALERGATNKTIHIESPRSIPTSAFTHLSGNGYYPMSFKSVRPTSDVVEGIPLASIDQVVSSKLALRRRKDIRDLELIANAYGLDMDIPSYIPEDDVDY